MSMRRPRPGTQSGFTLIELLIAVAIIGLIAAIAIPAMQFALDRSKQRATMSDMRMVGGAVMQYYVDNSFYPNPSLSAPQLINELIQYSGESLPYRDRWYHDFGYASDQKNSFSLQSFGRDGLDGANVTPATRNDFNLDLIYANGQFRNSPEQ
jgi:general secretion pathway protein G